jgi:uncharacterized membrane protein YqaE (UPF0057 family)
VKILLAILIPPLAVLLCGRVILAFIMALLWIVSAICVAFFGLGLIGWIPLAIVACYVVINHDADKRADRMAATIAKAQAQR